MIAAALVAILVTTVPPVDDIDVDAVHASFAAWALETFGVEVHDVRCRYGEDGYPPACGATTQADEIIHATITFLPDGDYEWATDIQAGDLSTGTAVPTTVGVAAQEEPQPPDPAVRWQFHLIDPVGWEYDVDASINMDVHLEKDITESPPGRARLMMSRFGRITVTMFETLPGRDAPEPQQVTLYAAFPDLAALPNTPEAAEICFDYVCGVTGVSGSGYPDDADVTFDQGLPYVGDQPDLVSLGEANETAVDEAVSRTGTPTAWLIDFNGLECPTYLLFDGWVETTNNECTITYVENPFDSVVPSDSAGAVVPVLTAPSVTDAGNTGGYTSVDGPTFPADHTAAVTDPPDDGTYWGEVGEVVESGVTFNLMQAFFGQACIEHFGTEPEACLHDYGVDDSPTASVTMPLNVTDISVVYLDQGTSYQITGEELARLTKGEAPSADAPDGFYYAFSPYLVTIVDGAVTSAHQVFQS